MPYKPIQIASGLIFTELLSRIFQFDRKVRAIKIESSVNSATLVTVEFYANNDDTKRLNEMAESAKFLVAEMPSDDPATGA